MSSTYLPINGNAGLVSFTLYDTNGIMVGDAVTSVGVIEFDENDEESELNSVFTNLNDELVKNHFGHRKVISFSLVNANNLGEDNLAKIFQIVTILNIVNYAPEDYRLQIQYRGNDTAGLILDAIYTGNFKINELSAKANIGQSIPLVFKSKKAGILNYSMNSFFLNMLLENGEPMLLERDTGDEAATILLEQYDIDKGA